MTRIARHDGEYPDGIIHNLLGADAACQSLVRAARARDGDFFQKRIAPFLAAYEE
jgi:hypothetical protein